ncbi:MarR family transcriptional regulator [Streptomyces sp. NPDC006296]|uniref:MarR family winged helix-turn-helix transcriptional regulator n=1 Tax=Streptomyces sp. NPDC006296 TaxID=3156746 RepID=UPI0033B5C3EF
MSPSGHVVPAGLTENRGRMRLMDLAKTVEWEKSRMSHRVGRMVKRGLVAEEDCPDDGRGAFVAATAAGREAIEDAAPAHVCRLFVDALDPGELDALARISNRVLAHMDRQPD